MNTQDIVLKEESYQQILHLCNCLMDPMIRTTLLHLIEDGGWVTPRKMTQLLGFSNNTSVVAHSKQRMFKLVKAKIVDIRGGGGVILEFRVISDRLFFINQFIQTYNKLK